VGLALKITAPLHSKGAEEQQEKKVAPQKFKTT